MAYEQYDQLNSLLQNKSNILKDLRTGIRDVTNAENMHENKKNMYDMVSDEEQEYLDQLNRGMVELNGKTYSLEKLFGNRGILKGGRIRNPEGMSIVRKLGGKGTERLKREYDRLASKRWKTYLKLKDMEDNLDEYEEDVDEITAKTGGKNELKNKIQSILGQNIGLMREQAQEKIAEQKNRERTYQTQIKTPRIPVTQTSMGVTPGKADTPTIRNQSGLSVMEPMTRNRTKKNQPLYDRLRQQWGV